MVARARSERATRVVGAVENLHAKTLGPLRAALHERDAQNSSAAVLALLAALSTDVDFSIGCYCADESHCHRSLLKKLLLQHGAKMA